MFNDKYRLTQEQFNNLKWEFVSSLRMIDRNSIVYKAEYNGYIVYRCKRTKLIFGIPFMTCTHFKFEGKTYKSKEELLKAVKDL